MTGSWICGLGALMDLAGHDLRGREADGVRDPHGPRRAVHRRLRDRGDGWRKGHVQEDMSFERHEHRLRGPAARGIGGEEAQLGVGVTGGEQTEQAAGADPRADQDLSGADELGREGGAPRRPRRGLGRLDLHLELHRVARSVRGAGEQLQGVAADRERAVDGEREGVGAEAADRAVALQGAERVAVEQDLGDADDDVLDDQELGLGLVGVDAEAADGGVQEVGRGRRLAGLAARPLRARVGVVGARTTGEDARGEQEGGATHGPRGYAGAARTATGRAATPAAARWGTWADERTGATGNTGSVIADLLLARGVPFVAMARSAENRTKLAARWHRGDRWGLRRPGERCGRPLRGGREDIWQHAGRDADPAGSRPGSRRHARPACNTSSNAHRPIWPDYHHEFAEPRLAAEIERPLAASG